MYLKVLHHPAYSLECHHVQQLKKSAQWLYIQVRQKHQACGSAVIPVTAQGLFCAGNPLADVSMGVPTLVPIGTTSTRSATSQTVFMCCK